MNSERCKCGDIKPGLLAHKNYTCPDCEDQE